MGTTKIEIKSPAGRRLVLEASRDSIGPRVNVAFECASGTMSMNLAPDGMRLVQKFLTEVLEDIPQPAVLLYNSTEGWSWEAVGGDTVHGFWHTGQEARAVLELQGYYIEGEQNDVDQ